jgi:hypothetical protein
MLLVVEPEAELGRERSSGAGEPTDGTDSFEPDLSSKDEEGGEEGDPIVEDNTMLSTRREAASNSREADGRERISERPDAGDSDVLRSRCANSSPEILTVRVDSPWPEVGFP